MTKGLRLANGVVLPSVGLGTYKATGESLVKAVQWALDAGIEHIDTALGYKNAKSIQEGLVASGRGFDKVFVTSKLSPRHQGTDGATAGCEKALHGLNMDCLDLMLIHWPGTAHRNSGDVSLPRLRKETWKVMEEFYKAGRFRAIGVSNYEVAHLEELMSYASIQPMVNQIEVHPRFPNREVRHFCQEQGIQVVAYSSFGTGDLLGHLTIQDTAQRMGKSPAQVLLKWGLQQGMAVIPKSIHKERIEEWSEANMEGWELDEEAMKRIDAIEDDHKYCWNPVNIS